MTSAAPSEWTPLAENVDEARFNRGRIGPYRLGLPLRGTALGEVVLALGDESSVVMELDLFDALADSPAAGIDGLLMVDLAQAATIEHPRVPQIVGAGIDGGVPYVARMHRLGRTLAETLRRTSTLPRDFAASVLYTIVEILRDLETLGPSPGAWSLGGFDARDVILRFDGEVELTGVGLQRVRSPEGDAGTRDLAAVLTLARELDARAQREFHALLAGASSFEEMTRRLRRSECDILPRRLELVGATLRSLFDGDIREERAFFGLAPLQ